MIAASEFVDRRRRLAAMLAEGKLHALIVSAPPNIRYLSGFTGSNAVLAIWAGNAALLTDPRYALQAAQETNCQVRVLKGSLHAEAAKLAVRKRWKRLGFERNRIAFHHHAEVSEGLPSGVVLKGSVGLVEQLRVVKSPAEIELIRKSVATNSAAFEATLRRFQPQMTELDLAAELDYEMRRCGAEKTAFETIVASGIRSALPHAQPTAARVENNKFLIIDMGAMRNGYASDMTRTLHIGKAGREARTLYNAILEAQLEGLAAIRDGVTAGSVDRKVRQVLKAHGYERFFIHSTGHGLGLEIHEPPRLGKKEGTMLKAGMVVTVEPGAYSEGFGGVRIEDTVLVTKQGCQVLTPTAKELITV